MPSASSLPCNPEKYSAECIAQVAAEAGFNKSEDMLTTAVAIAIAESSGRTKIVNSIGCCVGLWQINYKVHGVTKTAMQDPAQNAAMAYKVSNQGTKWTPWTVYNLGRHQIYMIQARAAAKKVMSTRTNPSSGFITPLDDMLLNPETISDLGSIQQALEYPARVSDWISDRNNIFRMVKVLAGVLMVAAGVVLVAKPMVENVAGSVVGGVVKGALKK